MRRPSIVVRDVQAGRVHGFFEIRAFHLDTFDVFLFAEVSNLVLCFSKQLIIHAETLHDYRGIVIQGLAYVPRNDSKVDLGLLCQVQNLIDNLLVEQMSGQLQREALKGMR